MADEITQAQKDASEEAARAEAIRSLAKTLGGPEIDCGSKLVKGVITAYTYPYLSAQLGGDTSTTITNIRHLEAYSPVVGDTAHFLVQGSDVLALGRLNTTTGASGLNGWTQPTLATGFTHSIGLDPVQWRVVNDHGDLVLQLRGSCTMSGVTYSSNLATVFTLPAGSRVAAPKSVIVPRDAGGVALKVNFLTSGVVQIDNLAGVLTSATQHGNLTTSYYNINHYHIQSDGVNGTSTTRYSTGGPAIDGVLGGSAQDGGNNQNHRHTTDSATHTHAMANAVPTAMWLTGISIFL